MEEKHKPIPEIDQFQEIIRRDVIGHKIIGIESNEEGFTIVMENKTGIRIRWDGAVDIGHYSDAKEEIETKPTIIVN